MIRIDGAILRRSASGRWLLLRAAAMTLGAVAALTSLARSAWADDAPTADGDAAPRSRIMVIAHGHRDLLLSAARKLAGELRAAGFLVTAIEREETATSELPLDEGLVASVMLGEGEDGVTTEVRVAHPGGDRWSGRDVGHIDAPDALAIHAAELLRATLLEHALEPDAHLPDDVSRWLGPLPQGPHARGASAPIPKPRAEPSRAPAPLPDTPPKPAGPTRRQIFVGLGGAAQGSFGGLPGAFGLDLEVRYRTPITWLDVEGRVAAPVVTDTLVSRSIPEVGDATVRHGQADVSVQARAGDVDSVFRPALGAGLGAHLTDVSGRGFGGARGFHADAVAFTPLVTADLELRFSSRLSAFVAMSTLFTLPEPTVVFVDTRVARTGEPLVLGTASVAVGL